MKITVITGSPHKNGTSTTLAEQFIRGAEKAGNKVYRFDAAFREVHPCMGCEHCHNTNDGCVYNDAVDDLNALLIESDAIVFASPIYYYAMSSQIKAVIDRFYANDSILHKNKLAVLILTMADTEEATAQGAVASFKGMINYLEWENAGILVGLGCGTVEDMRQTEYPQRAYDLGTSLKA